jgi:hypothetical protein
LYPQLGPLSFHREALGGRLAEANCGSMAEDEISLEFDRIQAMTHVDVRTMPIWSRSDRLDGSPSRSSDYLRTLSVPNR